MGKGYNWGSWADVGTAVDGDPVNDGVTAESSLIYTDDKVSSQFSITIGDPAGSVTGVVNIYFRQDVDNINLEGSVTAAPAFSITPVSGAIVRHVFSVSSAEYHRFKILASNSCGRQVTVYIRKKTTAATF